ncbi:MAG TPA: hypothetical protein EYP36_13060 [Calditrichaeota bacterium]|nr:hypothetical protein [Calditrichota bacterium]
MANDQTCSEKLNKAEEYYYDDALDEAQALVLDCLNNFTLEKKERIRAYTILVRISLARENKDAAKKILLKIFTLDPTYQPTTEQETPRYVNVASEAKQEFIAQSKTTESQKQSSEKANTLWLWMGAGVAVVVTTIVLVVSGSAGENPDQLQSLSNPPPFPQ